MLNKIFIGIIASLFLSLSLVGWLYKQSLEKRAELQIEVSSLVNAYEEVRTNLNTYESNMKIVNDGLRNIGIEYSKTVRELQQLRKNESKIIEKPEVAQRAIQMDMNKFIHEMVDLTSDKEVVK